MREELLSLIVLKSCIYKYLWHNRLIPPLAEVVK